MFSSLQVRTSNRKTFGSIQANSSTVQTYIISNRPACRPAKTRKCNIFIFSATLSALLQQQHQAGACVLKQANREKWNWIPMNEKITLSTKGSGCWTYLIKFSLKELSRAKSVQFAAISGEKYILGLVGLSKMIGFSLKRLHQLLNSKNSILLNLNMKFTKFKQRLRSLSIPVSMLSLLCKDW